MEIFYDIGSLPERPRAVAVGTFDGVHRGHREVILPAEQWARENGVASAAVTFDPHPQSVIRPGSEPRLLTNLEVKAELISDLGVDELIVIPFNDELAAKSAEQFCADTVAGPLGSKYVTVGSNFRFGHRARGDAGLLSRLGGELGYQVKVVDLLEVEGSRVSSTLIRGLVESGHVEQAETFLGHPFLYRGDVCRGDGRGRELGVPTANVVPDTRLVVPGIGIYAGCVDGTPAAVSVGVRPTYSSDGGVLIEAHLLDTDADLYGVEIEIAFLKKLRDELRFDDEEELVRQMREDIHQVAQMASAGQLC